MKISNLFWNMIRIQNLKYPWPAKIKKITEFPFLELYKPIPALFGFPLECIWVGPAWLFLSPLSLVIESPVLNQNSVFGLGNGGLEPWRCKLSITENLQPCINPTVVNFHRMECILSKHAIDSYLIHLLFCFFKEYVLLQ